MGLEIVLVEPEIPQNTGNIARTCAATGTILHLVKPLGFSISQKAVRRAGLDYWEDTHIVVWENFDEFYAANKNKTLYFSTTKGGNNYANVDYPVDSMLLFGKETKGLDESLLKENKDNCIRIPMKDKTRSLNLSNAVAILVYEYLRQHNFDGLKGESEYIENL